MEISRKAPAAPPGLTAKIAPATAKSRIPAAAEVFQSPSAGISANPAAATPKTAPMVLIA
ncbi:MAG: hypothetical protein E6K74_00820 [Candidatus Eisenbacteria bacterium]|uniref:Uncharacterized protein n=1 Tax=Eiseniibacteriota bacterium TaxID=2212470 RepID=A0A538SXY1_UNCEI|nr:MAG: hypothetical protein E6K74_00820 [Candidatus Eisenbacteria bacterium]